MVNIELTPLQANELKNFYAIELEKIQKRAEEIRGLLKKLDDKHFSIKTPSASSSNTPTLIKSITVKPIPQQNNTASIKKGQKSKNPNWGNYVLQVMQEQNKPLTKEQILKLYQKHFNISFSNPATATNSLSQALQRLRVKRNLIQSIKPKGQKRKLFSLVNIKDKAPTKTNTNTEKIVKTKKIEPKTTIERNRKYPSNTTYNWPKFIVETLNKTKRVLSVKDFLRHATVSLNIPKEGISSARNSLSPMLSTLVSKSKKLKALKKEGQTGRSYGLRNWFDDEGKLIAIYK
ncbi:MAG: hypothetical protein WC223_01880 [Bacteroidales bacterium]|jgi:hypothetical protein